MGKWTKNTGSPIGRTDQRQPALELIIRLGGEAIATVQIQLRAAQPLGKVRIARVTERSMRR